MEDHPLISVIVPIYKVEAYLRQCLDSIVNQTYKNLEIILVDDGSPDGCPAICDEYAARDNRIKVIHQMNGGLSDARNAGLDVATGEYIAFVDSDDWISLEMYETMLNNAITQDADVVSCSLTEVKGNSIPKFNGVIKNKIVESKETFFELLTSDLRFEVWNKLYKKDIIGDSRFIKGQVYEDLHFEREVIFRANRIFLLNNPFYFYRINRPGSTNSSFSDKRYSAFNEIYLYFELFSQKKWTKLYIPYMKLAMNFCINLYCMSVKWKSSERHSSELYDRYVVYYNDYKKNNNIGIKFRLFRYFPMCYYYLSQLHLRVAYLINI